MNDLEITPAVSKGGNEVALEYPASTDPTQAGVEVSLGQLVGKTKLESTSTTHSNQKRIRSF